MTLETILSFSIFAFVTSITPGPNNIMLLASGLNFGFRLTIPHILGISTGFLFLVLAVGLGLAEVLSSYPQLYGVLKWLSAGYLLYLSWAIAKTTPLEKNNNDTRSTKPMSYWGAAAFQWINPKAWIMAFSAFTAYVPVSTDSTTIIILSILFAAINMPSVGVWALFGSGLRKAFQNPRKLAIFNYFMAALLLASMLPLFYT
jgi:threonine/homoserine/homoserine lactone efflux protein